MLHKNTLVYQLLQGALHRSFSQRRAKLQDISLCKLAQPAPHSPPHDFYGWRFFPNQLQPLIQLPIGRQDDRE